MNLRVHRAERGQCSQSQVGVWGAGEINQEEESGSVGLSRKQMRKQSDVILK